MLVKDFECRSFEEAERLLGNESLSRRVCSNTVLQWRLGGYIGLYLHGNRIARFFSDGRIQLYSCGYKTSTTKDRLNKILPGKWQVRQRKFSWYLWNWGTRVEIPFVDGMKVPE